MIKIDFTKVAVSIASTLAGAGIIWMAGTTYSLDVQGAVIEERTTRLVEDNKELKKIVKGLEYQIEQYNAVLQNIYETKAGLIKDPEEH